MRQVGSLEEAKKAISAGIDAIIVQGLEAGGHVISQVRVCLLDPKVCSYAKTMVIDSFCSINCK